MTKKVKKNVFRETDAKSFYNMIELFQKKFQLIELARIAYMYPWKGKKIMWKKIVTEGDRK